MPPPRVALIGSCVTRDVWQFSGETPAPLFFTARTGLVSVMSAPVEGQAAVLPAMFAAAVPFVQRCLCNDINKTTLASLNAFRPDFLVLDFIDERFDLLQVGSAFISYSHDYQTYAKPVLAFGQEAIRIDRLTSQATDLWVEAAGRFVSFLRESPNLRNVPVLLHRAPWARYQVQGEDLTHAVAPEPLPPLQVITHKKRVAVEAYGELMQAYYDIFLGLMPEAHVIEIPADLHLAAAGHIWGRSAFHYVKSYYAAFHARTRAALICGEWGKDFGPSAGSACP